MPRNPFKRRSKIEQATERADLAADAVREAAATLRDRADALASEIDSLSPEVPEKGRRGAVILVLAGAAAAIAYGLRKAAGTSEPQTSTGPSSPTPTAPSGPTDDRLNDPALKDKVESELFADDDVDKGKISIDVADGVVTLRGEIGSDEMIGELTTRVQAIEGVRRVENLLTAGASKAEG